MSTKDIPKTPPMDIICIHCHEVVMRIEIIVEGGIGVGLGERTITEKGKQPCPGEKATDHKHRYSLLPL
ncbi:MAG: hypothetical protein WC069_00500 [Candidatus Shapirobacteria bacterium]